MALSKNPSLFSDFLAQLGVPHTVDYSDGRFAGMPFKSLFGLSKLLEEYGVPNEGVRISDKSEIRKLGVPFLAQTPEGFVIVTAVGDDRVSYVTQGVAETVPYNAFVDAWTGVALLAYPDADAGEPDYRAHADIEMVKRSKVWVLWYQKTRAKAWCTLCLSVQAILWLSFACYLAGDWLHGIFPLRMPFFVTGVCYVTVLLALNRLLPKIEGNE